MNLSREEQETIITFNEADKTAEVYTHNGRLKKQLNELDIEREEVTKISSDQYGFETFTIPKSWIKIRAKRILSEEQKELLRKRAKSNLHAKVME